jgi:TDG/mug DNA glycosylase family protein
MTGPLPDYLRPGLDVVFVGINPGLRSAATGHHYAGPANHFWPLLYEAGFVSEPLTYRDDARVLEWNIGLTNMVERASPGVADLSRDELRAGAVVLRRKLERYRPRVVAFNGKAIFDVFAGRGPGLGPQRERVAGAAVYVMPSTSPRGATYQKADKLAHFRSLKRIVAREARKAAS